MGIIKRFKGFLVIILIAVVLNMLIGGIKVSEGIIAIIVLLAIFCCLFYFGTGKQKRCPFCKKRHALKLVKSEVISQEDVSVLKEMKIRNNQRNETGSVEQYIPGVKTTYKEYYTCKY